MSHFSLVVITPDCSNRDGAEDVVGPLLAPYEEEPEGPEGAKFLVFEDTEDADRAEYEASEEHRAEYATFEDFASEYHGHVLDPKTRRFGSFHNPDAKWDFWSVGGRWTGYFRPIYDPEKDAANIEMCRLCGGTGQRNDHVLRGTCNGCNGLGCCPKWPTQWAAYKNDVVGVSRFRAELLAKRIEHPPFALLTPDGWHEKGEMLWWAMVADEKKPAAWRKEVLRILKANETGPDGRPNFAVIVDCHI